MVSSVEPWCARASAICLASVKASARALRQAQGDTHKIFFTTSVCYFTALLQIPALPCRDLVVS